MSTPRPEAWAIEQQTILAHQKAQLNAREQAQLETRAKHDVARIQALVKKAIIQGNPEITVKKELAPLALDELKTLGIKLKLLGYTRPHFDKLLYAWTVRKHSDFAIQKAQWDQRWVSDVQAVVEKAVAQGKEEIRIKAALDKAVRSQLKMLGIELKCKGESAHHLAGRGFWRKNVYTFKFLV
jgi:hypothetical protein